MLFNAPLFCYYSGRRRRSIPSGPGCLHSLYLSSVDQVRTLDAFPVCFCMWLKNVGPQHINDKVRTSVSQSSCTDHSRGQRWFAPLFPAIFQIIQSIRMGMWSRRSISPLRRSSLHAPNILALLEDDGRAVDAADLRQGSFSSPVSVYSVFGTGSFSMDGLQAGTRRWESGGRVPHLPPSLGSLAAFCQHQSEGVGGRYPQLLVPNKRNLKQTN